MRRYTQVSQEIKHKREGGRIKKVEGERGGRRKKSRKCTPWSVSISPTTSGIYCACSNHLNYPANCLLISLAIPSGFLSPPYLMEVLFHIKIFQVLCCMCGKILLILRVIWHLLLYSFIFISISALFLGRLSSLFWSNCYSFSSNFILSFSVTFLPLMMGGVQITFKNYQCIKFSSTFAPPHYFNPTVTMKG